MPIFRLCRLLQVIQEAWRNRGPSHVSSMTWYSPMSAFRRSRESYGAERDHELAENGKVGRHRVARLIGEMGCLQNGNRSSKRRRTASTTRPSHRTFSTRTSPPRHPTLPTSAISGRHRAGWHARTLADRPAYSNLEDYSASLAGYAESTAARYSEVAPTGSLGVWLSANESHLRDDPYRMGGGAS